MSVTHYCFGPVAVKFRFTRSLLVRRPIRFRFPVLFRGNPVRSKSAITVAKSLWLTVRPRSIRMLPEHADTHTLLGNPRALGRWRQRLRGAAFPCYSAVWGVFGNQRLTCSSQILEWRNESNSRGLLIHRPRPDTFSWHHLRIKQL